MKHGEAPSHIMRFAVQDYLNSPLRGQLALERDHLTRLAYLELLFKLHDNGGTLAFADVAGALLISEEEAGKAVARLTKSGRIVEKDGALTNPRVDADLQRLEEFSSAQAERGREGGLAKASARLASAKKRLASNAVTNANANAISNATERKAPRSQRDVRVFDRPETRSLIDAYNELIPATIGYTPGNLRAADRALSEGYTEEQSRTVFRAVHDGSTETAAWCRATNHEFEYLVRPTHKHHRTGEVMQGTIDKILNEMATGRKAG